MNTEPAFEKVGLQNYRVVYDLFQRNRHDADILFEFGDAFDAYLTPHETKHRILETYVNGPPQRIGELIFDKADVSKAVGIGWLDLTPENLYTYNGEEFAGANFSLFIQESHRRKGLGRTMVQKLMSDFDVIQQQSDPWQDRTLWTGARRENTGSINILDSLGFKRVGELDWAQEYDIYTRG